MRFQRILGFVILISAWFPLSSARRPACYTRNFNTIASIYNFTIYPNQLPIIAQATNSNLSIPQIANLFSPNVTGRVQDIGNFTDFRTSIEYFFGLAPVPRAPTYVAFSAFDLTQFSSDCPSVAASTVYFTTAVADPSRPDFGKVLTYLKQSGFWHFDEQGRVDYYDLWIPALQDFSSIINAVDYDQRIVQLLVAKQVCQGAQKVCTGANTQYKKSIETDLGAVIAGLKLDPLLNTSLISQLELTNLNDGELNCFAQLSKKPFGTFDKLWADSVACRTVHLILAEVDPGVHCPHVGPTGGGKCVDYPYNNRLFDDIPLFGEKYRFRCPHD
ncbi:hypothetical protein TWF481_010514 [Arthrobotrys musiformis]|uniref:Uncharacterized protein n=1 Tax=Arthrobotrys musiformis TaxID=47236 RepID=A0AAV9W154_9PEZI